MSYDLLLLNDVPDMEKFVVVTVRIVFGTTILETQSYQDEWMFWVCNALYNIFRELYPQEYHAANNPRTFLPPAISIGKR